MNFYRAQYQAFIAQLGCMFIYNETGVVRHSRGQCGVATAHGIHNH